MFEPINKVAIFVLEHIPELSAIMLVFTFLFNWILHYKSLSLGTLFLRSFAASMLPTGIAFILIGIDGSVLSYSKLNGLNIYIAAAGLATIYVSIRGLLSANENGNG